MYVCLLFYFSQDIYLRYRSYKNKKYNHRIKTLYLLIAIYIKNEKLGICQGDCFVA